MRKECDFLVHPSTRNGFLVDGWMNVDTGRGEWNVCRIFHIIMGGLAWMWEWKA